MDNTVALFDILRERESLALELKKFKEVAGIPLRDREQEIKVLNSAGKLTPRERSILNLIFEYTINIQENNSEMDLPAGGMDRMDPLTISGEPDFLHYMAGMLISAPGKEIHFRGNISDSLKNGVIDNGGHLIPANSDSTDLRVCLGFDDGNCSISLNSDGTMKIKPAVLIHRNSTNSALIEVS